MSKLKGKQPRSKRRPDAVHNPITLYDAPVKRDLRVNFSKELGPIDFVIGTNRGPANLADQYREFGITAIRIHDFYGPTDWWVIFPDWDADPDAPAGYAFDAEVQDERRGTLKSSDETVAAIVDNGFSVLYRLGTSWRGLNPKRIDDPPGTLRNEAGEVIHEADAKDFKKWARISLNTIRHYNEGWADGHHYGIKYWEIWNEPSNQEQFWSGTPKQFFEMYALAARAIKAHDPSLRVGGPARAGILRDRPIVEYQDQFIAYCEEHNVPLDFYSWHTYNMGRGENLNPYMCYVQTVEIRELLDRHGFTETEIFCNEWNTALREGTRDDGYGAANYASCLIWQLRAGCTQSYQYCGPQHPALSLFHNDGRPKRSAYGMKAFAMAAALPVRVHSEGDDKNGYALMGTLDGTKGAARILISDFCSKSQGFDLEVSNLPWKEEIFFTSKIYLVDDDHDLEVVEETTHQGDSLQIERAMKAGSVVLIDLRKK